jgi:hypothetical protein
MGGFAVGAFGLDGFAVLCRAVNKGFFSGESRSFKEESYHARK